ncbi:MAG: superoxide dismutase [Clostridiales bacterium]|nr:superoxide dismutase [Clostridiales bacterium]
MKLEKINFQYSNQISVVNRPQFEAHLRLYEGYVNKINEIDTILNKNPNREASNSTYSLYRGLKRGETFSLNGVILHELYFTNIGGSVRNPSDMVTLYINNYFNSFKQWSDDFIATAKASRGWAILCYDQRSKTLRNISLDAHDVGNVNYSFPILVLDMYEHAYFLQYADNKAEYINQFMKNINWEIVERRMNNLQKIIP